VHNLTSLNFVIPSSQGRAEVFGPFIRVTNSYNGLRALGFDIGFARMICANGVILPEEVIKFKFTHSTRDIGRDIHFKIAHDRLAKLRESFCEYIVALRACPVPPKEFERFVNGVLRLKPPEALERGTHEFTAWSELRTYVTTLCKKYAVELGENAYSVFNAVTEFATHPPVNMFVRRERQSFQRLAGQWVDSFGRLCRQPDFDLTVYLSEILEGELD
jgi:hypothetical protein